MTRHAGLILGIVLLAQAASAQVTQEGSKLVGTGAVGAAVQGSSVALSADGNTAIIGGPAESFGAGAVWVFTRSGGEWTQQGSKLMGRDARLHAHQGSSVAISADGNTAIVGGPFDNAYSGAAWVFARSSGKWMQQGHKLVGTGAVGDAKQGCSVAISADGNTAIVGGYRDNVSDGAAWVFARSGGGWSQQGAKLVGTGAVGSAVQGSSVAISRDGNTAIIGGSNDSGGAGAAWMFKRDGSGTWTQDGSKLVGKDAVGAASQGIAVAISGDGKTAIVGGNQDNSSTGAAWVYRSTGTTWVQQGGKLVGTGAVGIALQGQSVAISADGNTAIIGGPSDNNGAGAAWVFTRNRGAWTQQGGKLVGPGVLGSATQGSSVAISGDGNTAILGGPDDNSGAGAVFVFSTSSFGVWAPAVSRTPGVK